MPRHRRFNRRSANACEHYSLRLHGAGFELVEGFALIEFASKDGSDTVIIHPALLDALWELKFDFAGGAVVRINSGYRSPFHNARVGGRPLSRHVYGFAADVDVIGKTPKQVADWAEDRGFGGVGRYNTFTHLDVFGVNRRWDLRTPLDVTP